MALAQPTLKGLQRPQITFPEYGAEGRGFTRMKQETAVKLPVRFLASGDVLPKTWSARIEQVHSYVISELVPEEYLDQLNRNWERE